MQLLAFVRRSRENCPSLDAPMDDLAADSNTGHINSPVARR